MKKLLLLLPLAMAGFSQTSAQTAQLQPTQLSANKLQILTKSSKIQHAEESNSTFFESFEGWDGVTDDWIPNGWTEQNSSQELADMEQGRFTWHTGEETSTMPAPTDGKYYARIQYAQTTIDGKKTDLPQDEWLISPVFTPVSNDFLSFDLAFNPLYLFNVSNEYLDFSKNPFEFKEKVPATTMRIHIRIENGEWVLLKDVFDDYKEGYTFDDLFNNFSNSFHSYMFDLQDYVGKNVQIAFQFVGILGNSMALDNIKVDKPVLDISYSLPAGTMWFGMSDDFYTLPESATTFLVPAYTDLEWNNTTAIATDAIEWQYQNPENPDETITSSDESIITNYKYGEYSTPLLKAQVGSAESTFKFGETLRAGGDTEIEHDGITTKTGACNFDITKGLALATTADNKPIFGYHPEVDNYWSAVFGVPAHVYGITNSFDKPLRPYALPRMWVHAKGEVADDAEISMVIYEMSSQGALTPNILAAGTCLGSEIKKDSDSDDIAIPFKLKSVSNNEYTDDPVIIDKPIMAAMVGFDSEKVNTLGVYQSMSDTQTKESHGYFMFSYTYNGQEMAYTYPLTVLSFYSSFAFMLDMAYPYIECDDNTFLTGKDGGSKDFELNSYFGSQYWNVEIGEDAASWLSYSVDDNTLTLTAAPFNGSTQRTATVTVSTPGDVSKEFSVIQEASGSIGSLQSAAMTAVKTVSGNFVVIAGNGINGGEIYNIAGELVKTFSLESGNTIQASELSKGLYLIKFDNGLSVKAIK